MSFSRKIFVAVYGICEIYMCTRLISEEHKRLLCSSTRLSPPPPLGPSMLTEIH